MTRSLFLLTMMLISVDATTAVSNEPGLSDMHCGPRCVGFVLDYYQVPTNKNDASEQKSYGIRLGRDGASFHDLATSLQHHGVSSVAVMSDWKEVIQWPYPVIVHVRSSLEGHEFGHFVVWHPDSDQQRCFIWDGLNGIQSCPTWSFHERIVGGCLLTAPPGSDWPTTCPFTLSRNNWCTVAMYTMLVLDSLCILTLVRVYQRRSKIGCSLLEDQRC